MGVEIERKFIVVRESWNDCRLVEQHYITQGYIETVNETAVRIRTRRTGDALEAFLTIKGHRVNNVCPEFEYKIPYGEAEDMLQMCEHSLYKTRYVVVDKFEQRWEVDVFHGTNAGLIIAEIEMDAVDQKIQLPQWIGPEVSDDPNYTNLRLAKR